MSCILSAWANINRRGDFNKTHTHPGATWSGVDYVDLGEANSSTEGTPIHLSDPNPARTNIFFPELSSSNVLFRPEPGLMNLFPSYVPGRRHAASRRNARVFQSPSICVEIPFHDCEKACFYQRYEGIVWPMDRCSLFGTNRANRQVIHKGAFECVAEWKVRFAMFLNCVARPRCLFSKGRHFKNGRL